MCAFWEEVRTPEVIATVQRTLDLLLSPSRSSTSSGTISGAGGLSSSESSSGAGFKGAIPVSLRRAQISSKLKKEPYFVSEKVDGVRYLLLLTKIEDEPVAFFVNRRGAVYQTQIAADLSYFDNTVFDGELAPESFAPGQIRYVFWVFDLVVMQGSSLLQHPFLTRYATYSRLLEDSPPTEVDRSEREAQAISAHSLTFTSDLIMFRPKPFYNLERLPQLLEDLDRRIYGTDGLIFMPVNALLQAGTQWDQFKWKSAHTLDLMVRFQPQGDDRFPVVSLEYRTNLDGLKFTSCILERGVMMNEEAYTGARRMPAEPRWLKPVLDDHALFFPRLFEAGRKEELAPSEISGIVECLLWLEHGQVMLKPLHTRSDKSESNNDYVCQQTVLNVLEDIRPGELIQALCCGV